MGQRPFQWFLWGGIFLRAGFVSLGIEKFNIVFTGLLNPWPCVAFPTSVAVSTLRILCVEHAGAGMGGMPRGRSSTCV